MSKSEDININRIPYVEGLKCILILRDITSQLNVLFVFSDMQAV